MSKRPVHGSFGSGRAGWTAFLLALSVLLSGCQDGGRPASDADQAAVSPPSAWHSMVDGDRALDEVAQFVALGLRDSGTAGAERAAHYLRARLEALGIQAEIDAFEDLSPKGRITFRNVVGRIPGQSDGIVILGSHYDTQSGLGPDFEGANDSGSSTGLLLDLGRLLQAQAPVPGPSLVLAFFDGEEAMVQYGPHDGFHGSRHKARRYVESSRAADVRAVIVIDMIGDRDLHITIPRNTTPALRRLALEAAADVGHRSSIGLIQKGIGDDHVPFLAAGMPAVLLIDFMYGSAPGLNDYWHTTQDTMDKLSAESLAITGRIVMRMLEIIADTQTN